MKILLRSLAVFTALLSFAGHASDVLWNYNGMMMIAGSGCPPENTLILSSGDESSVFVKNFGLSLENESAPNSAWISCHVRIPLKVAKGYYVRMIHYSFIYGVKKSADSWGRISARISFMDSQSTVFKDDFRSGRAVDEPLLEKRMRPDFSEMAEAWCADGGGKSGDFKIAFEMWARRSDPRDFITMIGIEEGEGFRIDALTLDVARCPEEDRGA